MNKPVLTSYSILDLLAFHASITDELKKRMILRTANNPVADYAEYLAIHAFSLTPAPTSEKGYDATDKNGKKYQIKARRITSGRMPTRFSAIRKLEENYFDYLIAIVFGHDFVIQNAALMPLSVVKEKSYFQDHVNGWILPLRESLWEHGEVKDVTDRLRKVQKEDHGRKKFHGKLK